MIRLLRPFQRNKTLRQHGLLLDLRTMLLQKVKLLVVRRANGNDHPATISQLSEERLRDLIRRAGHDDGIEGRTIRPTLVAISGEDFYIVVSESFQIRLGPSSQRFNYLDG